MAIFQEPPNPPKIFYSLWLWLGVAMVFCCLLVILPAIAVQKVFEGKAEGLGCRSSDRQEIQFERILEKLPLCFRVRNPPGGYSSHSPDTSISPTPILCFPFQTTSPQPTNGGSQRLGSGEFSLVVIAGKRGNTTMQIDPESQNIWV